MQELTLSSVIIATADKHRLRAFYHDVLGLPFDAQGKLTSAGVVIHPALHSEIQGPPAEPHRIMLTFAVTNIQQATSALQAQGVAFTRLPEQEQWGGWVATFRDPDGNFLQLIQLVDTSQLAK